MRNFLTHKLSGKSLHMNNDFIVKSCIFWFKVSEKKLHFGSIWDIERGRVHFVHTSLSILIIQDDQTNMLLGKS